MSAMKPVRARWFKIAAGEKGFMLVAALTLMTALTLIVGSPGTELEFAL